MRCMLLVVDFENSDDVDDVARVDDVVDIEEDDDVGDVDRSRRPAVAAVMTREMATIVIGDELECFWRGKISLVCDVSRSAWIPEVF